MRIYTWIVIFCILQNEKSKSILESSGALCCLLRLNGRGSGSSWIANSSDTLYCLSLSSGLDYRSRGKKYWRFRNCLKLESVFENIFLFVPVENYIIYIFIYSVFYIYIVKNE